MNKLFLVGIAIAALFLSCSSDDDQGGNSNGLSQADIAGTWFLADYEVPDGETQVINGDNVTITRFTQEGKEFGMSLRFDESSNKVVVSGQYMVDTTTFTENGTLIETVTTTVSEQFNAYDYQINDDNITLTTPGRPTILLRINDLQDQRFIFSISLGQIIVPPSGTTVSGGAKYTFGK